MLRQSQRHLLLCMLFPVLSSAWTILPPLVSTRTRTTTVTAPTGLSSRAPKKYVLLWSNDNRHDNAADSLPHLDDWSVLEDGSLAGAVSGHRLYDNGDVIATSVVAVPPNMDEWLPGTTITTVTGSQYVLGVERTMQLDQWHVIPVDTDDETASGWRLQGRVYGHASITDGDPITTSCLLLQEGATPASLKRKIKVRTESGSKYELLDPRQEQQPTTQAAEQQPPPQQELQLAMLNQWKRLEGGSVAGYVTGHAVIPDGELITTSPLVELDERNNRVVVTTATGSQYQLGVPEPPKQLTSAASSSNAVNSKANMVAAVAQSILSNANKNKNNLQPTTTFIGTSYNHPFVNATEWIESPDTETGWINRTVLG